MTREEVLDLLVDGSTQDGEYTYTTSVRVCARCGALVLHQDRHDAWHEQVAGDA